jgi:hypothetical protein
MKTLDPQQPVTFRDHAAIAYTQELRMMLLPTRSKQMNTRTEAALNEIKAAVAAGQDRIAPVTFTHFFGRSAVSAAFRLAKQQGIIVVAYVSAAGTPVYKGGEA